MHIGSDQVEVGDEIHMEWKVTCKHPQLKPDGEYIVIGKDPTKYADGYVFYIYILFALLLTSIYNEKRLL